MIDGLFCLMSCRQFTWTNNLHNQTFEKLDRVLVCRVGVKVSAYHFTSTNLRNMTSYTFIFKYWGFKHIRSGSPALFKFELGWLLQDGFVDMVSDIWHSVQLGNTPLQRWQAKIRRLHQYLRGWAKNVSGTYEKEKNSSLISWMNQTKKPK